MKRCVMNGTCSELMYIIDCRKKDCRIYVGISISCVLLPTEYVVNDHDHKMLHVKPAVYRLRICLIIGSPLRVVNLDEISSKITKMSNL